MENIHLPSGRIIKVVNKNTMSRVFNPWTPFPKCPSVFSFIKHDWSFYCILARDGSLIKFVNQAEELIAQVRIRDVNTEWRDVIVDIASPTVSFLFGIFQATKDLLAITLHSLMSHFFWLGRMCVYRFIRCRYGLFMWIYISIMCVYRFMRCLYTFMICLYRFMICLYLLLICLCRFIMCHVNL